MYLSTIYYLYLLLLLYLYLTPEHSLHPKQLYQNNSRTAKIIPNPHSAFAVASWTQLATCTSRPKKQKLKLKLKLGSQPKKIRAKAFNPRINLAF